MTYALVVANAIQSVGPLPRSARRLDTQEWVMGLATADPTFQQACGYFPVTDVARPADTATDTFDRSVQLVNSVPTVVWTQRPMTAPELANVAATTNRATIQQQATTALVQPMLDGATITKDAKGRITSITGGTIVAQVPQADVALYGLTPYLLRSTVQPAGFTVYQPKPATWQGQPVPGV